MVQRVPVRIQLDAQQFAETPLRIGLSATAKVNVADTSGAMLREPATPKTLYTTDVLKYNESAVEDLIESIIEQNSRHIH